MTRFRKSTLRSLLTKLRKQPRKRSQKNFRKSLLRRRLMTKQTPNLQSKAKRRKKLNLRRRSNLPRRPGPPAVPNPIAKTASQLLKTRISREDADSVPGTEDPDERLHGIPKAAVTGGRSPKQAGSTAAAAGATSAPTDRRPQAFLLSAPLPSISTRRASCRPAGSKTGTAIITPIPKAGCRPAGRQ